MPPRRVSAPRQEPPPQQREAPRRGSPTRRRQVPRPRRQVCRRPRPRRAPRPQSPRQRGPPQRVPRRRLGSGCRLSSGCLLGGRGGLAGGDLARLLLVADLAEGGGEAAEERREAADQTTDGGRDDPDELSVEDFPGGQFRQRPDLFDVERGAVHDPALEGEQLGGAGVVGDRLGRHGGVAADEGQGGGSGEEFLQDLGPDLVGGAFGEGVLDHREGGVGGAEVAPQLGDLGHGDAAVVNGEDRLAVADALCDVGDRGRLLVSVHGSRSLSGEVRRPGRISGGRVTATRRPRAPRCACPGLLLLVPGVSGAANACSSRSIVEARPRRERRRRCRGCGQGRL